VLDTVFRTRSVAAGASARLWLELATPGLGLVVVRGRILDPKPLLANATDKRYS